MWYNHVAPELWTFGKYTHDTFVTHLALQVVRPAVATVLMTATQVEWDFIGASIVEI